MSWGGLNRVRRHRRFLSGSSAPANATAQYVDAGHRKQLRWAGSYTCRYAGSKTFQRVVSNILCDCESGVERYRAFWPSLAACLEQPERWLRTGGVAPPIGSSW